MYMIVCDVEGCDTVEESGAEVHGLHANTLPSGWRTVGAVVPPTDEEREAERALAEQYARGSGVGFGGGTLGVAPDFIVPGRPMTFAVCPKHALPSMKSRSLLQGAVLMGRRRIM